MFRTTRRVVEIEDWKTALSAMIEKRELMAQLLQTLAEYKGEQG
ncbi:hypothetical protein [Rhizobium leguminosarum]|nr:hypothetical protein [Rhizobium leguminosarum]